MRFTKVMREYVNEQLTKKRLEANQNDAEAKAYYERKNKADKELEELERKTEEEIKKIAEKYGLGVHSRWDGSYHTVDIYSNYVYDKEKREKIQEKENARYDKQDKALKEIEISCVLGASKEEFMQMIAEVEF